MSFGMLNESQLSGVLGAVAFVSESRLMYVYTESGWMSVVSITTCIIIHSTSTHTLYMVCYKIFGAVFREPTIWKNQKRYWRSVARRGTLYVHTSIHEYASVSGFHPGVRGVKFPLEFQIVNDVMYGDNSLMKTKWQVSRNKLTTTTVWFSLDNVYGSS